MTEWKIDKTTTIFGINGDSNMIGKAINLVTPEEFSNLPDGTVFYSIFGEKKVKGIDYFNDDTRGGHMAYGIL